MVPCLLRSHAVFQYWKLVSGLQKCEHTGTKVLLSQSAPARLAHLCKQDWHIFANAKGGFSGWMKNEKKQLDNLQVYDFLIWKLHTIPDWAQLHFSGFWFQLLKPEVQGSSISSKSKAKLLCAA
jgi:hypothetical protein